MTSDIDDRYVWPASREALETEQARLAALTPPPWTPPEPPLRVAAAFVAFRRGEQGPGHAGDRALVGAAMLAGPVVVAAAVVPGVAGAPYLPGLLALREGPMLEHALRALPGLADVDVLMVDATGRDHPRRAGLALHLGAVLDLPSVGVTHRGLDRDRPDPRAARWVETVPGVRPVLAHAAWRTSVEVAERVVLACVAGARSPEPLRQARRVAREARSAAT